MSSYEDMRDFQMREQYGDDYITPTFAFTGEDMAEMEHDHGDDWQEIMTEVMERDMSRYENERAARDARRISHLQSLLEENGIDYDG